MSRDPSLSVDRTGERTSERKQLVIGEKTGACLREPKISVLIPAYNEAERLQPTLAKLASFLDHQFNGEHEILILVDGGSDSTLSSANKFAENDHSIVSLFYPRRLGKGGAIIEGIKHAKGDVLILMDADGSMPMENLNDLLKLLELNDLVLGSRYMASSRIEGTQPLLRTLLSRGFNVFMKILFWKLRGISDTQCGSKALKKEVAEAIYSDLITADFAFDVNLIYSAMRRGFSVKEVGITWNHNDFESKVSKKPLRVSLTMFLSLIRLRIYYSRIRNVIQSRVFRKVAARLYYEGSLAQS